MVEFVISRKLKERAVELNKLNKRIYSMWYKDKETNTVYICTTHPGYWIGKAGQDHEKLVKELDALCEKYNIEKFKLAYKECQS